MQQVSHSAPLFESRLRGLKKIHQGKVRDIYDVDAEHLLIVTTDRLSAFDVVLPDPIPVQGRGPHANFAVLVRARPGTSSPTISPRLRVEDVVSDAAERAQLAGRAMVVKKLKRAAASRRWCAAISSARATRTTSCTVRCAALPCPPGCKWRTRLPEPLFTPASKAPAGQHDENIDFEAMVNAGRAANAPRTFGASPSRSIDLRPSTRARATSSSPTPNSSSASTRRDAWF